MWFAGGWKANVEVYKLLCSLLDGGKLMSRFISCYVVCWRVES